MYLLVLLLLRLTGKREIGNFSPFDFLVALMLGEIVDEAIYGDVPFLQFTVAAAGIAACQYVTGWLGFKSRKLDRLLQGTPEILVRNGEPQQDALARERVPEADLMAMLREQGIEDVREVKLGTLEVSGRLTVLKEEWAETIRKGDLPGKERRQKEGEEPPVEKRTSAEWALGKEAA